MNLRNELSYETHKTLFIPVACSANAVKGIWNIQDWFHLISICTYSSVERFSKEQSLLGPSPEWQYVWHWVFLEEGLGGHLMHPFDCEAWDKTNMQRLWEERTAKTETPALFLETSLLLSDSLQAQCRCKTLNPIRDSVVSQAHMELLRSPILWASESQDPNWLAKDTD